MNMQQMEIRDEVRQRRLSTRNVCTEHTLNFITLTNICIRGLHLQHKYWIIQSQFSHATILASLGGEGDEE